MFTYEDLFILSSCRAHPLYNCKDILLHDVGVQLKIVFDKIVRRHRATAIELPNMLVTAVKDNISPIPLINLTLSCFNVCMKVEHCRFDTIVPIGWALYYTTSDGSAICPYIFVEERFRRKHHATSIVTHMSELTNMPTIDKVYTKPFGTTKNEKQLCEYFNNCLINTEKSHVQPIQKLCCNSSK